MGAKVVIDERIAGPRTSKKNPRWECVKCKTRYKRNDGSCSYERSQIDTCYGVLRERERRVQERRRTLSEGHSGTRVILSQYSKEKWGTNSKGQQRLFFTHPDGTVKESIRDPQWFNFGNRRGPDKRKALPRLEANHG